MKFKGITTILLLASLVLCFGCMNISEATDPSERFKGYNKQRDKWVVGNLGKDYVEGDFVSYQLRIDLDSKLWGATEFSISFNFHQPCSEAIYVDGFDTAIGTGFQWSTEDFLPDGKPIPDPGWGTHIPTPEAGETWASGPKITNFMNAWPPEIGDGTPSGSSPAKERYFTVYGIPWEEATTHILLFFRAHLALDIIWSEGLEADLPTRLDGDEFETWTASWHGASFATGSSRHFCLQVEEVGDKTIPIPIAKYPETLINGHKYVDDVLFNNWEITLTGELWLEGLPPIPYNPSPVYTGAPPWTDGYFEFTGLVAGNYIVQEEDGNGYVHVDIVTSGDGTNEIKNINEGWVSFDLGQGATHTVNFYNLEFQELIVSKTATPTWMQTFTWTIEKTGYAPPHECIGEVFYTVTVTATPTNVYKVSGTITINNPNPPIVNVYAKIRDEVFDGVVQKGVQDLTPAGPILIPSGISTYDYSVTLSDPVETKTYTNKATVEVTDPVSKQYIAEKLFSTSPTEQVDEEADVDDSLKGFLGIVHYSESPKTFEYSMEFEFPEEKTYEVENTATVTGKDTGTEWDRVTIIVEVYASPR